MIGDALNAAFCSRITAIFALHATSMVTPVVEKEFDPGIQPIDPGRSGIARKPIACSLCPYIFEHKPIEKPSRLRLNKPI